MVSFRNVEVSFLKPLRTEVLFFTVEAKIEIKFRDPLNYQQENYFQNLLCQNKMRLCQPSFKNFIHVKALLVKYAVSFVGVHSDLNNQTYYACSTWSVMSLSLLSPFFPSLFHSLSFLLLSLSIPLSFFPSLSFFLPLPLSLMTAHALW